MRSLNLDQRRAFVEVIERGSVTAAAKELVQLHGRRTTEGVKIVADALMTLRRGRNGR